MPLCVILHGYRCGVETLILEVFSLLSLFHRNLSSVFKSFAIIISIFTRHQGDLVDLK